MKLVVSVLSLWLLVGATGCGRKKESGQAAQKRAASGPSTPRGGTGGTVPARDSRETRPAVRPGPADSLPADSPTGLAICDRYLKVVCGCAAKDPVLRKACDEGRKSAPKWKATSGKDPEQRKVVSDSCRKALKMIGDSFGCKP